MNTNNKNQDFGKRNKHNEVLRFVVIALLLGIVVLLEFTLGVNLEKKNTEAVVENHKHWAPANYNAPDGQIPIPIKSSDLTRIVFISNSHASTGGKVANHLQLMLDKLAPGRFDVLDLSSPGIFAPDMLQRTLRSLDFDPDLVILNMAYISLGDRMPLRRQAQSARSFFNDGIVSRLSPEFWLRNYDLGLYSSTLVSHTSRLYRYRNDVRDLWEQPLASALKSYDDGKPVLFLEVDENQNWKFPEGYDRNLFQWKLYASKREGHLKDLQELVKACKNAQIPLLATNLPIHFDKSIYNHDANDYENYRESLRLLFSDALEFVDYEDFFPKDFSTYDALHPTWHGARLHSFDLAQRLLKHGFLDELTENQLLSAFHDSDSGISNEFREQLNGNYPPLERLGFRRFDPSEPVNARKLMRYLATYPVGSQREQNFLLNLSVRIRYWLEKDFHVAQDSEERRNSAWYKAVNFEIHNAQKRMHFFRKQLVDFQSKRIAHLSLPLPAIERTQRIRQETHKVDSTQEDILVNYFNLVDGSQTVQITTIDGQELAYIVNHNDGTGYQRIDLFGDGSFLELKPFSNNLNLPFWINYPEPLVRWGI